MPLLLVDYQLLILDLSAAWPEQIAVRKWTIFLLG
jgi:hypothetical protein